MSDLVRSFGFLVALASPGIALAKPAPPACTAYEAVEYAKLGSNAFVKEFEGKCISFEASFRGEWALVSVYSVNSVPVDGRVFLNHRAADYAESTVAGFGVSSDSEIPPFPLSVAKDASAFVYEWKKGQKFTVKGRGKLYSGYGKLYLDVQADEIAPIGGAPAADGPAPPATSDDLAAKLKKLKDLHDQGLITAEEYEAKRKEILGGL